MSGFKAWLEVLQKVQGPKRMHAPSPTGARSLSMKPAKPARPGFNAFGMANYGRKATVDPNRKP